MAVSEIRTYVKIYFLRITCLYLISSYSSGRLTIFCFSSLKSVKSFAIMHPRVIPIHIMNDSGHSIILKNV